MEFIVKENKNKETAEERAVRRFGSIDNLRQQVVEKVQGSEDASLLLILYEIMIRQ